MVFLNMNWITAGLPGIVSFFQSFSSQGVSIFIFKSMLIWFVTGVTPANHLGISCWANHIWHWENIIKPLVAFWRLPKELVSQDSPLRGYCFRQKAFCTYALWGSGFHCPEVSHNGRNALAPKQYQLLHHGNWYSVELKNYESCCTVDIFTDPFTFNCLCVVDHLRFKGCVHDEDSAERFHRYLNITCSVLCQGMYSGFAD